MGKININEKQAGQTGSNATTANEGGFNANLGNMVRDAKGETAGSADDSAGDLSYSPTYTPTITDAFKGVLDLADSIRASKKEDSVAPVIPTGVTHSSTTAPELAPSVEGKAQATSGGLDYESMYEEYYNRKKNPDNTNELDTQTWWSGIPKDTKVRLRNDFSSGKKPRGRKEFKSGNYRSMEGPAYKDLTQVKKRFGSDFEKAKDRNNAQKTPAVKAEEKAAPVAEPKPEHDTLTDAQANAILESVSLRQKMQEFEDLFMSAQEEKLRADADLANGTISQEEYKLIFDETKKVATACIEGSEKAYARLVEINEAYTASEDMTFDDVENSFEALQGADAQNYEFNEDEASSEDEFSEMGDIEAFLAKQAQAKAPSDAKTIDGIENSIGLFSEKQAAKDSEADTVVDDNAEVEGPFLPKFSYPSLNTETATNAARPSIPYTRDREVFRSGVEDFLAGSDAARLAAGGESVVDVANMIKDVRDAKQREAAALDELDNVRRMRRNNLLTKEEFADKSMRLRSEILKAQREAEELFEKIPPAYRDRAEFEIEFEDEKKNEAEERERYFEENQRRYLANIARQNAEELQAILDSEYEPVTTKPFNTKENEKRSKSMEETIESIKAQQCYNGVEYAAKWMTLPLQTSPNDFAYLEDARNAIRRKFPTAEPWTDLQCDNLIKSVIGLGPDHKGKIWGMDMEKMQVNGKLIALALQQIEEATTLDNGSHHPWFVTRFTEVGEDNQTGSPRFPVMPPPDVISKYAESEGVTEAAVYNELARDWMTIEMPLIVENQDLNENPAQRKALEWMMRANLDPSMYSEFGLDDGISLFEYAEMLGDGFNFVTDPDLKGVVSGRARRMGEHYKKKHGKIGPLDMPGDRLAAGAMAAAKTTEIFLNPALVVSGAAEHGINNVHQHIVTIGTHPEFKVTKELMDKLKSNKSFSEAVQVYNKLYEIGGPEFVAAYNMFGGTYTKANYTKFLDKEKKLAGSKFGARLQELGDKVLFGNFEIFANDDMRNMVQLWLYDQQMKSTEDTPGVNAADLLKFAERKDFGKQMVTSLSWENVRNQALVNYNGGTDLMADIINAKLNQHGGIAIIMAGILNTKFVKFTWRALLRQIPLSNTCQLLMAKGLVKLNEKTGRFEAAADIAQTQAFMNYEHGFMEALKYDALTAGTKMGAMLVLAGVFAALGITPPDDDDNLLDYDEWILNALGVPVQVPWFLDDITQDIVPGAIAIAAIMDGKLDPCQAIGNSFLTLDMQNSLWGRGWYDVFFRGNKAFQFLEEFWTGFGQLGDFLGVTPDSKDPAINAFEQLLNIIDRATPMVLKDAYEVSDQWERDARYYNGTYEGDKAEWEKMLNQKCLSNPFIALLCGGKFRQNFNIETKGSDELSTIAKHHSFEAYMEDNPWVKDDDDGKAQYAEAILSLLRGYGDVEDALNDGFMITDNDYKIVSDYVQNNADFLKSIADSYRDAGDWDTYYLYKAQADWFTDPLDTVCRKWSDAQGGYVSSPVIYDDKYMYKVYNTSLTKDKDGNSYYYGNRENTGNIVTDLLRKWLSPVVSPEGKTSGEGIEGFEDTEVGYDFQTNSYRDVGVNGTDLTPSQTSGGRARVVDTDNKWAKEYPTSNFTEATTLDDILEMIKSVDQPDSGDGSYDGEVDKWTAGTGESIIDRIREEKSSDTYNDNSSYSYNGGDKNYTNTVSGNWEVKSDKIDRQNYAINGGDSTSSSSSSYGYSYGGGGSSYSSRIYAITPSKINADRAGTVYTKTPYSASRKYLSPGFSQQGSRDAYVRNLL